MIREILEKHLKVNIISENNGNHTWFAGIQIEDGFYFAKRLSKEPFNDNDIEQACRQYVKENGFKLEWLLSYIINTRVVRFPNEIALEWIMSGRWVLTIKGNKIVLFTSREFLAEDEMKLIAWLYANDVEVVE